MKSNEAGAISRTTAIPTDRFRGFMSSSSRFWECRWVRMQARPIVHNCFAICTNWSADLVAQMILPSLQYERCFWISLRIRITLRGYQHGNKIQWCLAWTLNPACAPLGAIYKSQTTCCSSISLLFKALWSSASCSTASKWACLVKSVRDTVAGVFCSTSMPALGSIILMSYLRATGC